MEVVGTDVAEDEVFEAGGGEVGFVEGEDVREAGVGHGHVGAELGELGVALAAFVDGGIDQLGGGMAEELERLHVVGIVGEDGGVGVRAEVRQALRDGHHRGLGRGGGGGVPFGIDAGGAGGDAGHGDVLGSEVVGVAAEEFQAAGIEKLERGELGGPAAGEAAEMVHVGDNGGGAGQVGHEAPHGAGGGQEAQGGFGHHAEGAFGADEEVDEVHVGIDEVAGGVLDGGAAQGREFAGEGAEGEAPAAGFVAAAAEIEEVARGQGDAEAEDVVAGGPVEVGEGAGGVAGDHAADGGGGFGGIGGEVEAGRHGGADGGQGGAGLHAHFGRGHGENPVHAGKIEDQAALGDGAPGDAGAGALHGERLAGGAGGGQRGDDLGLGAGEGDARGGAGAARLVAQAVGGDGLKRFDHGGQYSLLRPAPPI